MPLLLRDANATDQATAQALTGTRRLAVGRGASLTYAAMPAGARSLPHVHNGEQLTYVVSGEIWAFVIDAKGHKHAVCMQAGDFGRFPALAVHWCWNKGNAPCTLIAGHMPALHGEQQGQDMLASWEHPVTSKASHTYFVDLAHHPIEETERVAEGGNGGRWPGLFRRGNDIAAAVADEHSSARGLTNKMVYGHAGSLMVATRQGGYHTNPHVHECEQLNFVTSGRLSSFIIAPDGAAHTLSPQAGDFWRVPSWRVHWIRSDPSAGPFQMVELHCPGLQGDPRANDRAVPLFLDDEDPKTTGSPSNIFLEPTTYHVQDIEAKAGF